MGRRRPWIILAQLGVIVSFVLLSLVPEPAANLKLLSFMGFTLNVFTSIQDVAIDGMAIDVLPAAQRGRANGVMYGGVLAGFSLASAGGATLLNQYGFAVVALTGAGLVGVILFVPLFLRERPGERLLPWTLGEVSAEVRELQVEQWRTMASGVMRAVVLPSSLAVLAFAFLGKVPDGIVRVIFPVLAVQELGWTNTEYSQLLAVYGVVSAVSSLMIGATVVDRFGALRTIVIATLLGAAAGAIFGSMSHLWTIRPVFIGFLMLGAVLGGAGAVAVLALCMTLCWRRVAATQFALYMAVISGY
jgi:PAT family beta-lactamase induction signal transducer AmpG